VRETKARASGLPIFVVLTATALSLAMSGTLRAEDPIAETSASSPSDSTSEVNSTPTENSADQKLIELNKVLVIPQKCAANDGMMNCDPNEAPAESNSSNDSNATNTDDDSNSNSNPSADADSPDNKTPADAAAAGSAPTPDDDDDDGAVANASPAAEPSPNEPDISNPDTPLPDVSAQGNPTVASNDPNAITPQYGSLEDYQSQEDTTMMAVPVPVPMYPGSVYGAAAVPYPTYVTPTSVNPVGGAYAAARVYTPTYRPPFGPAGPWMTPPSVMMARPGLAAAPMARPAGRSFGLHR
jgi:hypothetical protein